MKVWSILSSSFLCMIPVSMCILITLLCVHVCSASVGDDAFVNLGIESPKQALPSVMNPLVDLAKLVCVTVCVVLPKILSVFSGFLIDCKLA
jgi:hypothetical protein